MVFKNKEHLRPFLWQASLLSVLWELYKGGIHFLGGKRLSTISIHLHDFKCMPVASTGVWPTKSSRWGCVPHKSCSDGTHHTLPTISLLCDIHPKTLLHSLHEASNTSTIWRSFHYLLVLAHRDWNVFSWHNAFYWKFREWSVSVLQWLKRKHLWKREKASSKKYPLLISGPVPRNSLSVRSCVLSQWWLICLC